MLRCSWKGVHHLNIKILCGKLLGRVTLLIVTIEKHLCNDRSNDEAGKYWSEYNINLKQQGYFFFEPQSNVIMVINILN